MGPGGRLSEQSGSVPFRVHGRCKALAGERALQEAIEQSRMAHLLSELPHEKYNKDQHRDLIECELCLIDYEAGDELLRLPCMHLFHNDCVSPWIRKAHTCPVCQMDVYQAV